MISSQPSSYSEFPNFREFQSFQKDDPSLTERQKLVEKVKVYAKVLKCTRKTLKDEISKLISDNGYNNLPLLCTRRSMEFLDSPKKNIRKRRRASIKSMKMKTVTHEYEDWVDQKKMAQYEEKIKEATKEVNDNHYSTIKICLKFFRKILAVERDPPIRVIIDHNLIPIFLSFLTDLEFSNFNRTYKIQFEITWILTNICSLENDPINMLIIQHFITDENLPSIGPSQQLTTSNLDDVLNSSAPTRRQRFNRHHLCHKGFGIRKLTKNLRFCRLKIFEQTSWNLGNLLIENPNFNNKLITTEILSFLRQNFLRALQFTLPKTKGNKKTKKTIKSAPKVDNLYLDADEVTKGLENSNDVDLRYQNKPLQTPTKFNKETITKIIDSMQIRETTTVEQEQFEDEHNNEGPTSFLNYLETQRIFSWCIKNIFKSSSLRYDEVKNLIFMINLTLNKYTEIEYSEENQAQIVGIINNCLKSLVYYTNENENESERISLFLSFPDLVDKILQFLRNPNIDEILIPAINIVSNIVSSEEAHTQQIISKGGLSKLRDLMNSTNKTVRKKAIFSFSNIVVGNDSQLEQVIRNNLFPYFFKCIKEENNKGIVRECFYVLSNSIYIANKKQIEKLLKIGILDYLSLGLSKVKHSSTLNVILKGIRSLLQKTNNVRHLDSLFGQIKILKRLMYSEKMNLSGLASSIYGMMNKRFKEKKQSTFKMM